MKLHVVSSILYSWRILTSQECGTESYAFFVFNPHVASFLLPPFAIFYNRLIQEEVVLATTGTASATLLFEGGDVIHRDVIIDPISQHKCQQLEDCWQTLDGSVVLGHFWRAFLVYKFRAASCKPWWGYRGVLGDYVTHTLL